MRSSKNSIGMFLSRKRLSSLDSGFELKAIYIVLSFLGLLSGAIVLLITGGLFEGVFFHGLYMDTGMDFFHSIEYTNGGTPYERFATLYPPLANLFYYVLNRFVPLWQKEMYPNTFLDSVSERGTANDPRIYQPMFVLFIIFIMAMVIMTVALVSKCLSGDDASSKGMIRTSSLVFACSTVFSGVFLYSAERGNMIIFAWLCALFFVKYRNSDNKILSELALIALAISSGLKLYPALLGFLLIYDRSYKKALRTVVYGILFFVLPFFAFKEGLGGFKIFVEVVRTKSAESEGIYSSFNLSGLGNIALGVLRHSFGINIPFEFGIITNIIGVVVMIVLGFFARKEWMRVLVLVMAFILFQSQYRYDMIFLLIPLIILIYSEERLTVKNIIPFILLTSGVIVLPVVNLENHGLLIQPTDIRNQVVISLILIYVLFDGVRNVISFFSRWSRKGQVAESL